MNDLTRIREVLSRADPQQVKLEREVSAELRAQFKRLKPTMLTEEVVLSEVTLQVEFCYTPGAPRDSFGGPIPSETELRSVKLCGVDLLENMTPEQRDQILRALRGEEARL